MRISLRLALLLILGITAVAFLSTFYQVRNMKRGLRAELERRAEVLGESLAESLGPLMGRRSRKELQQFVERFGNRERLAGIAVYDERGHPFTMTSGLEERLRGRPTLLSVSTNQQQGQGSFISSGTGELHVYVLPLRTEGIVTGTLALVHDAGYIEAQTSSLWRDTFLRVLIQTFLIVLITLLIIRWSITRPIARTAQWIREMRMRGLDQPTLLPEDTELLKPLTHEVAGLAKSLAMARAAAEEEARLREASESLWTAERLGVHVKSKLPDNALLVVSNREPYMHLRRGKTIETVVPASGIVTALEPILCACDGTWVANGSGDADREVVDQNDRLRVPPEEPRYTLRRVWLTKEEEEGYYFGFSNEGLWPLCHIAHTRPTFRASDWNYYQQVNHKFAQAVEEELGGIEHAVVWVHDYHFALLPRMIKEKRPDARVAIFWHIPWPNPEGFGICPWQRELLDGLLGADLLGFHTQAHCNNFLETVDQALESRIEWERFAVNRRGHITLVRPFPISVAFVDATTPGESQRSVYLERAAIFKDLGVQASFLGVGVERIDYTKGILERFRGLERFLEKYPSYQGQFTFVQIGAPSRTHIKRYHDLLAEIEAEADRINWRFQTGKWKPIVFLEKHHSHREIEPFYKTADLCMVTSLHDGMNLVAKEFVAARQDEEGALILSRFTGACRELRDALIVNPYDTEQLADTIRYALEMDPEERRSRMRSMRRVIREHNVYKWAGNMIAELAEIRIERGDAAHAGRPA